MPPRKQADKEEVQAKETNEQHVEVARELEQKAREEGDVNARQESDKRQQDAEANAAPDADGSADANAKTEDEVREENAEASKETETEEGLVSDALDLRDETLERSKKPFDTSNFYAQRAVFDTSGTAGVADQDMRRAYPAYDLDALDRQDVPAHLAKYVVSDEGLPAVLKREEELRKDAPSTKKGKKS